MEIIDIRYNCFGLYKADDRISDSFDEIRFEVDIIIALLSTQLILILMLIMVLLFLS